MKLLLRETAAPALALFTSLTTLLCCALPALLITVGAGAVMAGLTANLPGLIWLSAHKGVLFIFAGVVLTLAIGIKWATRNAPCPVDPKQAAVCAATRRWGTGLLVLASVAYLVGGFFAFFASSLLL